MNRRRSTVSTALALAGLSWLAAPARAQTNQNTTDFKTIVDAQLKETILHFKKVPDTVPKASSDVYNREGNLDRRLPKERYLHPEHPGVQPRPSAPVWHLYTNVPNDQKIPISVRPDAEAMVGKFETLPAVKSPETVSITYVNTPPGIVPEADPYLHPPGTNLLPTVTNNALDGLNQVMENTLPSTRTNPYNLHDGDPIVTLINPRSPSDDLENVIDKIYEILTGHSIRDLWERLDVTTLEDIIGDAATQKNHERSIVENADLLRVYLKQGIDIIKGEPISDRAYSGFPLLHHSGQKRVTRVIPLLGSDGSIVGANANVHQVWYDGRIESDTMFLDFGALAQKPELMDSLTWTITYTIDVLERGRDDFATTTMYFDDPKAEAIFEQNRTKTPADRALFARQMEFNYRMSKPAAPAPSPTAPAAAATTVPRLPSVSMDQTFFPIDTGTRTVLKIKMPPPKYFNLTYTWGWRLHPPRAQAMENFQKRMPDGKPIVAPEIAAFTRDNDPKFDPISALGHLAPERRMLRAFELILTTVNAPDQTTTLAKTCLGRILDARDAFLDWKDRTHLPSGIRTDPDSDLTLFYVNNTIYGELQKGGWNDFPTWRTRGTPLRVTLINGDYFPHGYVNVDFGGSRGWESVFKSALRVAGTGSFFSFGRFHYKFNVEPATVSIDAAKVIQPADANYPKSVEPAVHRLWIQLNHDPSRRLRFYQFDPAHHDVAIFSVH